MRPVFVVTLRALPHVGLAAIRALLKLAARSFGLRCVAIRCEPPLLDQRPQGRVADERVHDV